MKYVLSLIAVRSLFERCRACVPVHCTAVTAVVRRTCARIELTVSSKHRCCVVHHSPTHKCIHVSAQTVLNISHTAFGTPPGLIRDPHVLRTAGVKHVWQPSPASSTGMHTCISWLFDFFVAQAVLAASAASGVWAESDLLPESKWIATQCPRLCKSL